MHQCVISVGSNIAPAANIARAETILADECRLLGSASVIETAPVGFQQQPNFLNTAFLVETALERTEFKQYLKAIEQRLGRTRGPIKSGPRTIDLDIILWDGELIDPGYHSQDYVKRPVDELLTRTRAAVLPRD